MTQYLGLGLVIERDTKVYEYRSRANNRLYFEEITTGEHLELDESKFFAERESGQLRTLNSKSSESELEFDQHKDIQTTDISAYPEKSQARLLRAYDYVKGIERRKISRGKIDLIEEAIQEISLEINDPTPPSARSVSSWARAYQRGNNELASLLDKRCFKRPHVRTEHEHETIIQEIIDEDYMTLKRNRGSETYRAYRIAINNENTKRASHGRPILEKISERTFYRRLNARDKFGVATARYGHAQARNDFRIAEGRLPSARPLDYVEMDSTLVDLYVIDDHLRLPLGRPTLHVLKDRFSGLVLGFYASFAGASAEGALTAIANSFKSREAIKQRFPSIRHDWPIAGPATVYVTDNGSDFHSLAFKRGIAELGSILALCKVRVPWHKASVESFFKDMNRTLLESLPGKTFSHVLQRHDYKPERDAVVRFSVFVELLYKWAIDFHNQKPHSRKLLSPYQQWMDGMKDLPLPLPPDPRTIDLMIGETNSCKASHEGVRYQTLNYTSPALRELYQTTLPKQFEFRFSRQNLGKVYVLNPKTHQYFEATCTRLDYAHGLSLTQHQMIRAFNRARGKASSNIEDLLQSKQELTQILSDDLSRSKKVSKKISRFVGISTETVLAGKPATAAVIHQYANPTPEMAPEEISFDDLPSYPVMAGS